jgi:hypothetical protein
MNDGGCLGEPRQRFSERKESLLHPENEEIARCSEKEVDGPALGLDGRQLGVLD